MSRILVYIWAIFATEIDSIPYGIFFTITSIFKIRTSHNSSVKKGFSRGDCFFFFFFVLQLHWQAQKVYWQGQAVSQRAARVLGTIRSCQCNHFTCKSQCFVLEKTWQYLLKEKSWNYLFLRQCNPADVFIILYQLSLNFWAV